MNVADGTMPDAHTSGNGFDKLSRPYRWLEYLSFGPLLWQTRVALLPRVCDAHRALLLGDGDGRFAAALLGANRTVEIHAVDASYAMLQRLRASAAWQGDAERVRLLHADAREQLPAGNFDLVCSHFFLDCLTDEECGALAARVVAQMQPSACWLLSEFAIPRGSLRWPAALLVRSLYMAFALLTGLRVSRLPRYAAALHAAGLLPVAERTHLGGILRAELWMLDRPRSPAAVQRIEIEMSDFMQAESTPGPVDDGVVGAGYPPNPEDEVLPSIPGDPVPNPEPEQPSLGVPDPGIFEGTGGTASVDPGA